VSVSGDFSLEHCEAMAEGDDGAIVIDNSSAFRYKDDISLCVPEINADSARKGKKKVIANPNCTTAIGIMALYPLHQKCVTRPSHTWKRSVSESGDGGEWGRGAPSSFLMAEPLGRYGLKRVLMSTYQAASGAGKEGMDELFNGAKEVVNGPEGTVATNEFFAHPLPFNIIPHIDVFQENQYTKEEMKVTWECRKIMDIPNLPASCSHPARPPPDHTSRVPCLGCARPCVWGVPSREFEVISRWPVRQAPRCASQPFERTRRRL
jgi:aspartate-semialdehyde dehydrogenase